MRRGERPDAGLLEQLWRELAGQRFDLSFEVALFDRQLLDPAGEAAERAQLEFLFSANRLNVAISRARCLAYLVASPRLLEVDCRSIEQMRLANALCRLGEAAEASQAPRSH